MVMFKEMSIINSYTLESSFHGTEPVEEYEEEVSPDEEI